MEHSTPHSSEGTPDTVATSTEIRTLVDLIDAAANEYSEKGHKNKKGAIAVQFALIALSALTTIFLGWKFPDGKGSLNLINWALVFSASVAGLNVINAFFDYKELWVQYKVSRNELKTLRAELMYLEASYGNAIMRSQVKEVFDRYKTICNETNTNYQQLRMAKDSTEK